MSNSFVKKIDGSILRQLRHVARWSAERAAATFGITTKTLHRWESSQAPGYAALILTVVGCGDLGPLDWPEWKINGNTLWTPNGYDYSQGDIMAIFLQYQRVSALTARIKELEKEISRLKRTKTPTTAANDPHYDTETTC